VAAAASTRRSWPLGHAHQFPGDRQPARQLRSARLDHRLHRLTPGAISAIRLAELSAGPHQVRRNDEQDQYDEHAERARRLEILQRAENEFEPVPFDAEAARLFGRVTAAVITAGRTPRRRIADLMIAATAIAEGLPLYTTNPDDYAGLDSLLPIMGVARPPVPHEHRS
jgi:predicted nucleic acid-binding protein